MPVQHRRASLYVSPCIYLVVSLKCILTTSMRRRNGRCTPKLQHKTPLSAPLSPVIWALIYVLFWQRLTSFLAASLHACTLGENNKSLGLPSRRAPWRVACVRRSPPLCAPPELKSLRTPYFPLSIFSHLSAPCQWLRWQATLCPGAGDRRVTPLLCVRHVHVCQRLMLFTLMARHNLHTALTYAFYKPQVSHKTKDWIKNKQFVLQILTCRVYLDIQFIVQWQHLIFFFLLKWILDSE